MARMTGFEAFQMFRALKLHFGGGYDYHTHSGRIGNRKQFESNRGRYFFDKIAKQYTPEELEKVFVANLLDNPNVWIKDILADEGHEKYLDWCKRNHSLTERFREDLKYLMKVCNNHGINYNTMFVTPDGKHPLIIELVLTNKIDFETICILDTLMKFTPYLNRDLDGDPNWEMLRGKMWNYKGFITFEPAKMYEIAKEIFI